MPRLVLSFPYFQPAALRGVQMGDTRKLGEKGAECLANQEATSKPNTKPFSSARNHLPPSLNFGHESETTNWESLSVDTPALHPSALRAGASVSLTGRHRAGALRQYVRERAAPWGTLLETISLIFVPQKQNSLLNSMEANIWIRRSMMKQERNSLNRRATK